MGRLERRVQQLEELYAMSGSFVEEQERRAGQQADLLENLRRAKGGRPSKPLRAI